MDPKRSFLLAIPALLLAGACTQRPPPLGPVPDSDRLYYDTRGGIADSLRMVVRDAGSWLEVWTRVTAERAAPPPLPTLDFEEHMAVVVAGGRMTPEDRVRVDSVGVRAERSADGDVRDVLAVIVQTTHGCGRFNADAYPVEIVRVRRFDGPVTFVERRADATCTDGRPGP